MASLIRRGERGEVDTSMVHGVDDGRAGSQRGEPLFPANRINPLTLAWRSDERNFFSMPILPSSFRKKKTIKKCVQMRKIVATIRDHFYSPINFKYAGSRVIGKISANSKDWRKSNRLINIIVLYAINLTTVLSEALRFKI